MSRVLRTFAALALGACASFALAAPAGAEYGHHAGAKDVWQVGISFNCNNRDFCGDELGGFWGWVEFDRDPATGATSADAEFAGCGHGGGGGGAGHISIEVTGWFIAPGDAGPHTFWVTGGTETDSFGGEKFEGPLTHDDGTPVTPASPDDTGIAADPGHYSTSEIRGFVAPPGVADQIQVAYKPAH